MQLDIEIEIPLVAESDNQRRKIRILFEQSSSQKLISGAN